MFLRNSNGSTPLDLVSTEVMRNVLTLPAAQASPSVRSGDGACLLTDALCASILHVAALCANTEGQR